VYRVQVFFSRSVSRYSAIERIAVTSLLDVRHDYLAVRIKIDVTAIDRQIVFTVHFNTACRRSGRALVGQKYPGIQLPADTFFTDAPGEVPAQVYDFLAGFIPDKRCCEQDREQRQRGQSQNGMLFQTRSPVAWWFGGFRIEDNKRSPVRMLD